MIPIVRDLARWTKISSFHDGDIGCSTLESLPTGLGVIDMQKKIVFLGGRRRAHQWPAASRSDWPLLCLGNPAALRSGLRLLQPGLSRRPCHENIATRLGHRFPASPKPERKFPSAFTPFPFTTSTAPSSARSKRLRNRSPPPMFAIATLDRSIKEATTKITNPLPASRNPNP